MDNIQKSVTRYTVTEDYQDLNGEQKEMRVVLEYDNRNNTISVLPNGSHSHFGFFHKYSDKTHMWKAACRAVLRAATYGEMLKEGKSLPDADDVKREDTSMIEGPTNY